MHIKNHFFCLVKPEFFGKNSFQNHQSTFRLSYRGRNSLNRKTVFHFTLPFSFDFWYLASFYPPSFLYSVAWKCGPFHIRILSLRNKNIRGFFFLILDGEEERETIKTLLRRGGGATRGQIESAFIRCNLSYLLFPWLLPIINFSFDVYHEARLLVCHCYPFFISNLILRWIRDGKDHHVRARERLVWTEYRRKKKKEKTIGWESDEVEGGKEW